MRLNINTISTTTDITTCMSIQPTEKATQHEMHLQGLKEYIIRVEIKNRGEVKQKMRQCWTFRGELTMIDVISIIDK